MPDHAHLLIAPYRTKAEQVAIRLKGAATTSLTKENHHPFANQPYDNGRLLSPWTSGCWIVYLDDDRRIQIAINYVKQNPVKENMREQAWSFISPQMR